MKFESRNFSTRPWSKSFQARIYGLFAIALSAMIAAALASCVPREDANPAHAPSANGSNANANSATKLADGGASSANASLVGAGFAKKIEDGSTLDSIERKVLFNEMVARVHGIHVFAKHTRENLSLFDWDDDEAPGLAKEFDDADTTEKLEVALFHFVNSLHDMHCRYKPPSRGKAVRLRLRVNFEFAGKTPVFYVAKVFDDTLTQIEPGDVIDSVDGMPPADILRLNRNVTSQNNWDGIGLAVARFLTSRRTAESGTHDGDISEWILHSKKTNDAKHVRLTWREKKDENLPDDSWVDYANGDCGNTDPAMFDGYSLTGRGAHYCLYTATKAPKSFYPIVRQVSFRYFQDEGPQAFLADHDTLALRLALLKDAKGVILDMRENGGGNDPNSFVDWWAPARSYTDSFTVMRISKYVPDAKAFDELVVNTPSAVTDFYAECLKNTPSATFCPKRPFQCKPHTCDWDNHFLPSHQVTRLPVALVTGPGCGSSCDAFALVWKRNHFGPIVGTYSMAGFTTNRYRAPVPSRIPLGTFDLAFSYDATEDGEEVEGARIEPDTLVAMTSENYARYDTVIADAAMAALASKGATSSSVPASKKSAARSP